MSGHAVLHRSIWSDRDFTRLSSSAQRTYLLLLSQPDLSRCGVLSYIPKRWTILSADGTLAQVEADVAELEAQRFVIVDRTTDELLIRTYVKHDGGLKVPNIVKSMWRQAAGVFSDDLRAAFLEGLPEGFRQPPPDAFPDGFPEVFASLPASLSQSPPPTPQGSPNGSPKGSQPPNAADAGAGPHPSLVVQVATQRAERKLDEEIARGEGPRSREAVLPSRIESELRASGQELATVLQLHPLVETPDQLERVVKIRRKVVPFMAKATPNDVRDQIESWYGEDDFDREVALVVAGLEAS